MGLDVYASIVIGVHLERRTGAKVVTKYNEDTGEPYQRHEADVGWFIEGTEILVDTRAEGVICGDYEDASSFFLGVVLVKTGGIRDAHPKICQWIPEAPQRRAEAEGLLQAYGYTGVIRQWLVLNLSY